MSETYEFCDLRKKMGVCKKCGQGYIIETIEESKGNIEIYKKCSNECGMLSYEKRKK